MQFQNIAQTFFLVELMTVRIVNLSLYKKKRRDDIAASQYIDDTFLYPYLRVFISNEIKLFIAERPFLRTILLMNYM